MKLINAYLLNILSPVSVKNKLKVKCIVTCPQVSGLPLRSLCVHAQVHPCDTGAHLQRSTGPNQW